MDETKPETTVTEENATSEVSDHEVKDTFLGLKSKNIFFAFIGLVFVNYLADVDMKSLSLFLLLLSYTFPLWFIRNNFSFKNITLKSVLFTIRDWFVWTVIFVLIGVFLIFASLELNLVYDAFHHVCVRVPDIMIMQYGRYSNRTESSAAVTILFLSTLWLFTRFHRKVKAYKHKDEKDFYLLFSAKRQNL